MNDVSQLKHDPVSRREIPPLFWFDLVRHSDSSRIDVDARLLLDFRELNAGCRFHELKALVRNIDNTEVSDNAIYYFRRGRSHLD